MTYHAKCDHQEGCHRYTGPVFDNELHPTIGESPGWYYTHNPNPPYQDLFYCPVHAEDAQRTLTFLRSLTRSHD